MHAEAAKSCGQAVRFDPSFSCGHEAGSRLKRCLPEMVAEAVTTGSHGARPSRSTSTASDGEMGAAALRQRKLGERLMLERFTVHAMLIVS